KLLKLTLALCDDADRMRDMGFAEYIDTVINAAKLERQTLLFSATYPDNIQKISAKYQHQPVRVTVESLHNEQAITEHFYELRETDNKTQAVLQLLTQFQPESCIIFCNTKNDCQSLADSLNSRRVKALALHGDLEQKDRDRVLVQFSNKSVG